MNKAVRIARYVAGTALGIYAVMAIAGHYLLAGILFAALAVIVFPKPIPRPATGKGKT